MSVGKAIFGSRAAIEFSFGEKERPAQRRSNSSIVLTARVSEGKAIFGSRAAIEFISEAMPRVNSRLVKLTTLLLRVKDSRLVKRTIVHTEEFKTTSAHNLLLTAS
ncbi:hypothetical protein TNCV_2093051 [Trichonephila clavipes]|nr:hypothetical protein TNCV_2093051 [Trichonephila clavipes]